MWKHDAATVGASYHRIAARHQGRFLLGLGIGHPEATQEYRQPYATLVSYLDDLDDHVAIHVLGPDPRPALWALALPG